MPAHERPSSRRRAVQVAGHDLYLEDLKDLGKFRRGFDFTHDIVRENLLVAMAEILERYDVDGLEMDWMRWARVFLAGATPH